MNDSLGLILVVDDEEMNRDMLGRRLEIEGYSVILAAGGKEALRLLPQHPFDAVLLDAMMPEMSGYQVLAEVRKIWTPLDLPVLMVTARHQSEDMVSAFDVGANDYITKPINFPVAIARLQSHVSTRRLSNRLKESEERYSLSAQGANDGLWDWDLVRERVHFSDRWKSMLGHKPEEVGDTADEWFRRVHPEDLPHVQQSLAAHRSGQSPQFESEHRMLHHDGTYRWVLTRGMAVRDAAGRETRMAGSQTDITRGKAADPLTGLPNRVLFMDHLAATVARAGGDNFYAVLFLDLDRFKVINDSLGHIAGDELLVSVARRLETCMRGTDVVTRLKERCTISRFGGDEFVILLKGLTEPANATLVADRILAALAEPHTLNGHAVTSLASIGIAVGTAADSPDDLLRDADMAMYQAKAAGKGRWTMFDPSMRERAIARLELEQDLRESIRGGQLYVHYQPIMELSSGRLQGVEALLRWQHPVRGLVPPSDFIPVAEEIGFINEVGAWVLDQACRQARVWQLAHPAHANLSVSVNVSTRQFADPKFVGRVRETLARTGLDGRHLRLEITESAIMSDPAEVSVLLGHLREMGVQISLDDFGTGYSSLSYLQDFKIDRLKIDRSFIARLGVSEESDEIVRTIVQMAHSLGMEVIAEGIEEQFQHARMQSIACEFGQGYLYSRPVDRQGIETLLRAAEAEYAAGAAADAGARDAALAG